jgi:DNA-binding transcriptional regulator YiaG
VWLRHRKLLGLQIDTLTLTNTVRDGKMKKPLPTMTADELRSIRLALGKTTAEMADALGVGLRAYQLWEAGQRSIPGPAVLLARRIADENKS